MSKSLNKNQTMKPLSNITLPLRNPNGFNKQYNLPYKGLEPALQRYLERNKGRVFLAGDNYYSGIGTSLEDRMYNDLTAVVGRVKGFTDTHAIIESLIDMNVECDSLEVFFSILGELYTDYISVSEVVGVYIGEKRTGENSKSDHTE